MVAGLSTRNYRRAVESVVEGYGIEKSSVSRQFVEASSNQLRAPMVAKLAKIGIVPGQDFDASKLEPGVAAGIAKAPKPAQERISAWLKECIVNGDGKLENGWTYSTKVGVYGTNYIQRAMVAWYGLGANLPKDAVYPTSEGPEIISKYNGANKYVMHFEKGNMPPVDGFWSLTMYNAAGGRLSAAWITASSNFAIHGSS